MSRAWFFNAVCKLRNARFRFSLVTRDAGGGMKGGTRGSRIAPGGE